MILAELWDKKRIEQQGELLVEDGRFRPGNIHERTLQLVGDGWDLVALSPTMRRFRRPKAVPGTEDLAARDVSPVG